MFVVFRFVFVTLGPIEGKNIREYEELGRAAGTLFSDKVAFWSEHDNNNRCNNNNKDNNKLYLNITSK